jgi:DNA-binding NarL/FixJ family response regulator
VTRSLSLFLVITVRIYQDGLRSAFAADPRFDLRGTARDIDRGLEAIRADGAPPDVVVVDVAVPEGLAGVRRLAEELHPTRMLALGLHETPDNVIAWTRAGACGFLSAEASLSELFDGVVGVARGEPPCSRRAAAALLNEVGAGGPAAAPAQHPALTAREREVATLLRQGRSNSEIARRLHIEHGTVKNHVHNVLTKLDVRSRGEAVALLQREEGMYPWAHVPVS